LLKALDHFGEEDVDIGIILKWVFKNRDKVYGVDYSGSE
jgi:hypothetical protein